MTKTVAGFLARFDEIIEERDGWVVRCPAHDDSKQSLRVAVDERGALMLHCRATCNKAAVLDALGMSLADLFGFELGDIKLAATGDVPPTAEHIAELESYALAASRRYLGSPAAEYALERFGISGYLGIALGLGFDDGQDEELQWERLSPRKYSDAPRLVVPFYGFDETARGLQGRALEEAEVRWCGPINPEGHAWSKLAVFTPDTDEAYALVCEGPGDGLTAAAVGYVAVAIRGAALGANEGLRRELIAGLRGKRVVLCGDNDRAGKDFNAIIAAVLTEAGIQAHVMRLPDGVEDLSHWRKLDPKAFPDALRRAVRNAPLFTPDRTLVPTEQGERSKYAQTDLGNAERLRDTFAGNVAHATGVGFLVYTGRIWQRDVEDKLVRAAAQDVGRAIVIEAEEWLDELRAEYKGQDEATVKAGLAPALKLRAFGLSTQNTRRIDAMLVELAAMREVSIEVRQLDRANHLLTFRNGVVNLKTGELLPHDRSHYLTHEVEHSYNADAKCPRWLRFLDEVFPGMPELPGYVQRIVGYGITGDTSEQCFFILWGRGANGKSAMLDAVRSVFNQITKTTSVATFEAKQSGSIPNDVADLRGARIVMASEGERGRTMSEATIKALTGQDEVQARFMRQEFFTFKPTFSIIMATNHKPVFKGQDHGLWRRVKLVPFLRTFAKSEQDPYLNAALANEAEGIAAWAVAGAVSWYAQGLDEPAVITSSTDDYKQTSDPLAGFYVPGEMGWLVDAPGSKVLGKDVMTAYQAFADEYGIGHLWSPQALYSSLEERGLDRKKSNQGQVLVHVRLTSPLERENAASSDSDSDEVTIGDDKLILNQLSNLESDSAVTKELRHTSSLRHSSSSLELDALIGGLK